jgi:hypothetical protein
LPALVIKPPTTSDAADLYGIQNKGLSVKYP